MKINSQRIKIAVALLMVAVLITGSVKETNSQATATWDVFKVSIGGAYFTGSNLVMAAKIGLQQFVNFGAQTWVLCTMAAGAVASIASGAIVGGLCVTGAAAVAVAAYLAYKNIQATVDANGNLLLAETVAGGLVAGPMTVGGMRILSTMPNLADAQSTVSGRNDHQIYVESTTPTWATNAGWEQGWTWVYNCTSYWNNCQGIMVGSTEATTQPVSAGNLQSMIETDLASSDAQVKALAQAAAMAATGAVADPWNEWRQKCPPPPAAIPANPPDAPASVSPPAAKPGVAGSQLKTWGDQFRSGISQADVTYITNQDTVINNNNSIVNNGAASDLTKPLTRADIEAGVKAGIQDVQADGGTVTPLSPEADETLPDKLSIPTYLDTFYNSIRSLPVITLLTNIQLTASSGSPSVDIQLPALFGVAGQHLSMNFSSDGILGVNYGYYLGLIGNILLAFCGIRWTMYLFKSGEQLKWAHYWALLRVR